MTDLIQYFEETSSSLIKKTYNAYALYIELIQSINKGSLKIKTDDLHKKVFGRPVDPKKDYRPEITSFQTPVKYIEVYLESAKITCYIYESPVDQLKSSIKYNKQNRSVVLPIANNLTKQNILMALHKGEIRGTILNLFNSMDLGDSLDFLISGKKIRRSKDYKKIFRSIFEEVVGDSELDVSTILKNYKVFKRTFLGHPNTISLMKRMRFLDRMKFKIDLYSLYKHIRKNTKDIKNLENLLSKYEKKWW